MVGYWALTILNLYLHINKHLISGCFFNNSRIKCDLHSVSTKPNSSVIGIVALTGKAPSVDLASKASTVDPENKASTVDPVSKQPAEYTKSVVVAIEVVQVSQRS